MAGRKSKYFTHVEPRLDEIRFWCREGLTEEEICKKLKVAVSTFAEYKKQYPELPEALKEGKEPADNRVVDGLFRRATGYEYIETRVERERMPVMDKETGEITGYEMVVVKDVTTTKQLPPDTIAGIYWTKNRMPENWKDRQEHGITADLTIVVKKPPGLEILQTDDQEPGDVSTEG